MSFVQAVREYAIKNYEKDGWDYVVEAWEDAEIEKIIAGAKTERAAIARMRREVKPLAEYRADIQATAW